MTAQPLQRTRDWHESRLGKFTASNIHKIMSSGRGKDVEFSNTGMTYIKEKAAEIITGVSPEINGRALDWGNDHEGEAIELYELLKWCEVVPVGFVDKGIYGGSPDGLVGGDGMIEVKCPYNSTNHIDLSLSEDLKKDKKEYYYQIQMNLLVTGRKWCDFISYDPRCEAKYQMNIKRIEANEEDQKEIERKVGLAKIELDKIMTKLAA